MGPILCTRGLAAAILGFIISNYFLKNWQYMDFMSSELSDRGNIRVVIGISTI